MFKAVQTGDYNLTEFYLKSGVDPNYQHPEYMASALVESIRFEHLEITALLLEHGADPQIEEVMGGETPLSVAEMKNNKEAVDLIHSYIQD